MGRMEAASRPRERGLADLVVLGVRRVDLGGMDSLEEGLEEGLEEVDEKLGRGTESGSYVAERNPPLWLLPCRESS